MRRSDDRNCQIFLVINQNLFQNWKQSGNLNHQTTENAMKFALFLLCAAVLALPACSTATKAPDDPIDVACAALIDRLKAE